MKTQEVVAILLQGETLERKKPMRDWVNNNLVSNPSPSVVTPTMVHRTVLPGIGPSYFPLVRTMTIHLVTSAWLSITKDWPNSTVRSILNVLKPWISFGGTLYPRV